jgi:hypothetical protein
MSDGGETLWAVIVGAILATAGGFAATRLEDYVSKRARERSAAVLFGEILSVLELIVALANESRARGEPYGPFTMRLLRAVRREIDVYDRNRESLYDLRDATVRARIHTLMVQVTMSLEGIFESSAQIDVAEAALAGMASDDPHKTAAEARLTALITSRQQAFSFTMDTVAGAKSIMSSLRPLARQQFDAAEVVVRDFLRPVPTIGPDATDAGSSG